jgi:hypothetical protein
MPFGVTGTRQGCLDIAQAEGLYQAMHEQAGQHEWFHHGDCIGVDAQAHDIALEFDLRVHIHPPVGRRLRAFCQGAHLISPPKPQMDRNRDIVVESDHLIVVPPGAEHSFPRSGTWATYRIARRLSIPTTIIYPGGAVVEQ